MREESLGLLNEVVLKIGDFDRGAVFSSTIGNSNSKNKYSAFKVQNQFKGPFGPVIERTNFWLHRNSKRDFGVKMLIY